MGKYERAKKPSRWGRLKPLHLMLCAFAGLVAMGFSYDSIMTMGDIYLIPVALIGLYVLASNIYLLFKKGSNKE